jgi:hypothetical protein
MSVILSMELLITGAEKDVKEFWVRLNPKDEPLTEKHLLQLLNREMSDDYEYFDGYEVQKRNRSKEISITWSGGFGGFDQGYLGTAFRDDGVALSELFPKLDFTLYYDSHGAEFAGGYGSEIYADSDAHATVYGGGVRYQAGVRVGEKTLTDDDYFLQNDEDDEEWLSEPDYENNRQKIDDAIEKGELRPSTLYYRNKWEKKWLSGDWIILDDFVLSREFWREVPLLNTEATYIDQKLAEAALRQSIYAIIFLPATFLTPEVLDRAKARKSLDTIFNGNEPDRMTSLLAIGLGLFLLIASQPYVQELIRQDPEKFPVSDQNDPSDPDGFAPFDRALRYLMSDDPESAAFLKSFKTSVLSGDEKGSREGIVWTLRFLCSKKFDEADEQGTSLLS